MRHLLLILCLGFGSYMSAQPGQLPSWAEGAGMAAPLWDEKSADSLVFSDPTVWKFGKDTEGKGFIELDYDRKNYKSPFSPKHRSPIHIALFKNIALTDFVFTVEVMSTTEKYGHQDACLFFNFESPEKYYYVHLAPAPDANAHNVFIVNEAPRKNLLEPQKTGIEWKKDTWHTVRVVRQATTGKIDVFFDDMSKPVLSAEDKTFQKGTIGFGSFDDTARFRRVNVNAKMITRRDKPIDFFKPLGK